MFILNTKFENLCFITPLKAVVSEDLNGKYELYFEYLFDKEKKFENIENDNIVNVDTPFGKQFFRIYKIVKNLKIIKVNARHIFYDLLNTNVTINTSGDASSVLTKITQSISNFKFFTNINKNSNVFIENENIVKALLGNDNEKPKFIQNFGGEILRDNFNISILENIGDNRGYSITYGKNMTELEVVEDFSDICTKLYAFGEGVSGVYESEYIGIYANPKIHTVNFNAKNMQELNNLAYSYLKENELPKTSISVNFIFLKNTTKYKDFKFLEEVFLGDIVRIYNKNLGVSKSAKVVSYEYDSISKSYNTIVLGDFKNSIVDTINSNNHFAKNINSRVKNIDNSLQNTSGSINEINQNIDNLNNVLNGYIRIIEENLYILDNPDTNLAKTVYRFNSDGIAKSVNGIKGTFTILIN